MSVDAEFIRVQSALAGRYSLERELGRGGMGIVYLARDVALDRLVALKLLPPQLANEPRLRQRFLNEARTAAKFSHPNIIPIFSVEEVGDLVFFVMAYVDGETLGHRIRSQGPIPPSETARILREVAWGLAYAHNQSVIHRDVKADNILLERGSGRALVADFGIARVTREDQGSGAREILGTAEYMSPEQASGGTIDPRSDIYSLGVVAFYALSGRLPFDGANATSILAMHITQAAPRVRDVCDGVPSRLAHAVDRCLEKDPDARFPKAEDVADAIAAVLEARRELPPPIRVFIKRSRELSQVIGGVAFFQLTLAVEAGFFTLAGVPRFVGIGFLGAAAVLGTIPIGPIIEQARTLLKSGYTRADVIPAWRTELEREREERAFEHGRTASLGERAARDVAFVSLAGIGGAIYAWTQFGFSDDVATGFVTAAAGVALGGLLSFIRYDRRTDVGGRCMSWFWKTKLGEGAFRLASIGLRRSAIAAPATHRPTELAIGMAVDALYEALPKASRQQLGDLPKIVRGLEADAMKLRRRVDELNEAALHDPGLRNTRDDARRRMADAVTSLESIRLNLLRLTAGAGSVDSLTADLSAAREMSQDIGRLLAGHQEVAKALSSSPTERPPRE
ncbi:MAG TPA: serine/threonine-protein kinase [Gemmatimonadaceae bacterium]|nr:serine/threonine-protein kinase [Gemmatimonadaceae bacterium]